VTVGVLYSEASVMQEVRRCQEERPAQRGLASQGLDSAKRAASVTG